MTDARVDFAKWNKNKQSNLLFTYVAKQYFAAIGEY